MHSKELITQYFEFEQIVKEIFKEAEYEIEQSSNNESEMFDIKATKGGKTYYIEVKLSNYKNKVPISFYAAIVQKLIKCAYAAGAIPVFIIGSLLEIEDREHLQNNAELNILDISNLLYAVKERDDIRNKLVTCLPFSISEIVPQESFLRIETLQHSTIANSLINKLEFVKAGRKEFGKFEDACKEVLQYIFEDDLTLWKSQAKSNKDLYRFDCLCRIKNNNRKDFWTMLERYFNTKYVVFEFKNYSEEITQKEIYTTEKYLYAKALRRVAIVITKNGYDNNSEWAAKGCLRENGKLILLLDMQDMRNMCELKKANGDASVYLMEKLDSILLELEK